jgi:hypothetical protein
MAWIRVRLCKLQKRCTQVTAASDKVYQLLAHGRWFSPGTPASSTTKTGRHHIAEILLKVALTPTPLPNQTNTNNVSWLKQASHTPVMVIVSSNENILPQDENIYLKM